MLYIGLPTPLPTPLPMYPYPHNPLLQPLPILLPMGGSGWLNEISKKISGKIFKSSKMTPPHSKKNSGNFFHLQKKDPQVTKLESLILSLNVVVYIHCFTTITTIRSSIILKFIYRVFSCRTLTKSRSEVKLRICIFFNLFK